jgi:pyruvate dehydrogenase (quinone)
MVALDGRTRNAHGHTDETTSSRVGVGQAPARGCDCLVRQRHHCHVVRAANAGTTRPDVFAFRHLATMGNGLPYTIAAQIAHPKRQCVAFVGDGGFSMLMAEFATAVRYGLPIKVIIIKNNTLGQIKWEQMVFLGNPEYGCDLHPIDFAAVAQACGGVGMTVDDPKECGRVIQQALQMDAPVVVQAVVDPHEPPMPPRVEAKQALHFAQSLARGTPERMKIVTTVTRDRIKEMV